MTDEMHDAQEELTDNGVFEKFVDKQKEAAEEFTKALEELFPPNFREHTRKAGQAFVESFRELFEAAREDLEDLVKRGKEKAEDVVDDDNGGTKVKVDIE